MTGLTWLVSYPKSGNTWVRAFIANMINDENKQIDINKISIGSIASSREWLDETIGYDSADLNHEEIDWLRPLHYSWHANNKTSSYHKVHDAWTRLPDGSPLFPANITKACLYIVRNPLDVVISLSHHSRTSIDETIQMLANPDASFCSEVNKQHPQLRQRLLTWSEHAQTWLGAKNMNIKIIRYEDMLFNPVQAFKAVAEFLDISCDNIENSINATSFNNLQKMETKNRFREAPQHVTRFFRKGIAGDWKSTLRPDQINKIISDHEEMMIKLGYIGSNRVPKTAPLSAHKDLPMLINTANN